MKIIFLIIALAVELITSLIVIYSIMRYADTEDVTDYSEHKTNKIEDIDDLHDI